MLSCFARAASITPRTSSTDAATAGTAPSTAISTTASRVSNHSMSALRASGSGYALSIRFDEIRRGLAAPRERLHRFFVQDRQCLHFDFVSAIVLHDVQQLPRTRDVGLQHRPHL